MLRRLTRALVLAAAVAAAVGLPSLAVGLLGDGEPVACGCGCGRDLGSCCCAAPNGTDPAMRCSSDRDHAEAPVAFQPPAVTGSESALSEPGGERWPSIPAASRPWSVVLEPDPPIPEAAAAS
ncbi:MAG TPA: hypothetical protein VLT32_06220 [Candidatus Sulfomarinibacteraceae bacterium]|nr:hypothetical protein [Candidatus Sulfomarinibacteraceae bacterium]